MLKNYFKITLRNLYRNRLSTFINLFGLSVGISACLLIFLLVKYEISFDSFHKKSDRTYRVLRETAETSGQDFSSSAPYPMYEALMNDFPELERVTQVFPGTEYQLSIDDDIWIEEYVAFADSAFFDVFDFRLIAGNSSTALKRPNSIVISETVAKNHFGDVSPIGKTIKLQGIIELNVTGIVQDAPKNSHFPYAVLVSRASFAKELIGDLAYDHWGASVGFTNYVVLPLGMSPEDFDQRLVDFPAKYLSESDAQKTKFFLQPLAEIHTDTRYANTNPGYTIDPSYLWILGATGFFILSLACINFINLSTAIAIRKSKEVGVRKTLGASRTQLIVQYLGEAFLLTFAAALIALGIVERVLPILNQFLDAGLAFNLLSDSTTLSFVVVVLLFVAFSSGLYPAWILSGYKPVVALKNKITSTSISSLFLRKGLVTFQFAISQVLIIGTIVVGSQMNFFRSTSLGFDKENIITMSLGDNDPVRLETFKNRLLTNSSVRQVSYALGAPTSENDIGTNFSVEGHEEDLDARLKAVDFDYKDTFGLNLVAGRWLLDNNPESNGEEFVINTVAVRSFGFASAEEALGKQIGFGPTGGPIVGVVEDFHMKPLHEAIQPVVMTKYQRFYFEAGIKINDANTSETLQFIEATWKETFPGYIFSYKFLDDALEKNYASEQKIYTLFRIFSGISICIGCLGLFGLISFMVIQKTKEIGVRKVLGASVSSILVLFSNDFLKLLLIAFILAAPLSWYVMNEWLSGFAYRIDLSPKYLIWGGIINVIIALITIGYQAMKAAIVNPVESLRDE